MFGVRARIGAPLAPSGLWATALPASWLLRGEAGSGPPPAWGRAGRPHLQALGLWSSIQEQACLGPSQQHGAAAVSKPRMHSPRKRISGTGVFQGKPDICALPDGAPDPATPLPHTGASQARSACRLKERPMLWVPPGASDSARRHSGSFQSFPGASTLWPSLRTQLLQVLP